MNGTKKSSTKKTTEKQKQGYVICINKDFALKWAQIMFLEIPVCIVVFYILVQILFFKIFKCNESENIGYCQCVQFSMSEELSFWEKLKLIALNPSADELTKYVPLKNSTKCRIQNLGFLKNLQSYGAKTKEHLGKAIDGVEDYGEKAKEGIKDFFDNK